MKGNKGIGIKKDVRLKEVLEKLSKEFDLPIEVINKIAVSQFKVARQSVAKGYNIRFIKLFMLYNRHNKNEKYLKIKEDERQIRTDGDT